MTEITIDTDLSEKATVTGEDGKEHEVYVDRDGFVPKVIRSGWRCFCAKYGRCVACKFFNHEEMTAEERKFFGAGPIRLNRAKCLKCGDELVSETRHDYRTCECGNLSVDGGSWYGKRNFRDGAGSWEEMLREHLSAKDEG
jgi:hypothetical protein